MFQDLDVEHTDVLISTSIKQLLPFTDTAVILRLGLITLERKTTYDIRVKLEVLSDTAADVHSGLVSPTSHHWANVLSF